MRIKLSFEDKTICNVETYVKIDDVECEIGELTDLLNKLEILDVPISCGRLKNKLLKLDVIKPSKLKDCYFKRSKNYDTFFEKILNQYKKIKKKSAKS
jgi:hypothetical protein